MHALAIALLIGLVALHPVALAQSTGAPQPTIAEAVEEVVEEVDAAPSAAAVQLQRATDMALRDQLRVRLAVVPGLEKVRVEVTAGVVTLSGEAADDDRRQLALTLMEQADGVVYVDNQLQIDTDVRVRTAPVFEQARESAAQLVAGLPLFALALTIIVGSAWLGRWLARQPRLLGRTRRNPFLANIVGQAIHLVVVLVGVVVALDLLNATALVGALLGTAGIIGIALGFAFRDVAENYIAGVLLSLRQPFAPHDHVVIDGHEGKVAALTSRATILITLDGNHLRLPNALVFKGVMLNYSRNPTRRFSFDLDIGGNVSVSDAQAVALSCLRGIDGVLEEPAPSALLTDRGASGIVLRMGAWVDQRATSLGRARSEALRLVRRALLEAGIDMPDPGYRVELIQPAEAGTRTASARAPTAAGAAASGIESVEVGDLSPESHIDRQVDDEQAGLADANLLDPNARRE